MNNKQNKSNDSIDQWLTQSMNGFQPEVHDHAWNEIANRLPKRQRRPVYFWYTLAAVLFVGIILFFSINNNVKTNYGYSSDKLEVDQKVKSNAEINLAEEAGEPVILNQSSTFKSNSEIGKINNHRMSNHSNFEMESRQFLENHSINLRVIDPFLREKNIPIGNNSDNNNYTYETIQTQRNEVAIELPKLDLNILKQEKISIIPKHAKAISNIWIGGQITCLIINHSNSENTRLIRHFEKMGSQSGVHVQMDHRHHWRFGIGIAYQQYNTALFHNTTLRLKDGVPINPDLPGLKNYAFNYDYNTPTGRSSVHILMSEQDHASSMPLDEPFYLSMRTDQRVQSWVLPLKVQRLFGKRKLQFSLGTGALISYNRHVKNTIVHYSELCQDLCFSSEKSPVFNTIPIKRFLLEGTLGIGIEYFLKPRIRINISPEVSYGNHGFQKIGIHSGISFNIK